MSGDVEPNDAGDAAITMRRDGFFGWRAQPSRERSVLDDLAVLTAKHGPWEAAHLKFNIISEGDADVA